jgi:molybdenum cofactor guanylyltransferase
MRGRHNNPISVAILAGGRNSRFSGQPKALIPWNGQPLISHYLSKLRPFTDDLFVIANEPAQILPFYDRVFTDHIPGKGPLSGIHAALKNLAHPMVLVVACDMPFLPVHLIPFMIDQACLNPGKAIIPSQGKITEPMFGLWPSTSGEVLEQWLAGSNSLKIIDFVEYFKAVFYFDVSFLVDRDHLFFNINTPEDLKRANDIARFRQE